MSALSVALITKEDGPHAQAYIGTLAVMERVNAVHMCDTSGRLLEHAAEILGAKLVGTSTDIDECLKKGPYAFVLVTVDNLSAPAIISKVLDAGFHVFSEKTGARTSEEWKPLKEKAEKRSLLIGMSYPNRYRPSVQEARRVLQAGYLGRLYGFYVQSVATQAILRDPKGNWMFEFDKAGGGYIIWLGCHYLDLLRYVTGEEVVSVAAQYGRVSPVEFDVEDSVGLALKLNGGAIGAANFGYYLGPGKITGGKQSQLTFWGELGWMKLQPGDDETAPLEVYSEHPDLFGTPYRKISFTHTDVPKAYGSGWGLAFLNDFLAACLGEKEAPIDARDAEAVLEIAEAAYHSAKDGRTVAIQ